MTTSEPTRACWNENTYEVKVNWSLRATRFLDIFPLGFLDADYFLALWAPGSSSSTSKTELLTPKQHSWISRSTGTTHKTDIDMWTGPLKHPYSPTLENPLQYTSSSLCIFLADVGQLKVLLETEHLCSKSWNTEQPNKETGQSIEDTVDSLTQTGLLLYSVMITLQHKVC